ncbi:TBC1 domain family member 13 [Nymphaea thermarum]|nr:TBC1 domain family member 13 [Nymphaea thermarum]
MARSVPEWMMGSSLWSSLDDRPQSKRPPATAKQPNAGESPTSPPSNPNPVRSVPPPKAAEVAESPPPTPSPLPPPAAPPPSHFPSIPPSAFLPSPARPSQPDRPPDVQDPASPLPDDAPRRARFLAELSKRVIDLTELRKLAAQGVPDSSGIRSIVWKVLLGYLPCNREIWPDEMRKKRVQYEAFKEELLINPSELARRLELSSGTENDNAKGEGRGLLHRSEITQDEHPLSLGKTSVWNKYFQDTEIIEQIDRDVMRTHPGMHFFSGDSPSAKSNQEALKRILVVFAKLNPGIRYVQGMNEVLAPIFYVFRNDPDEENAAQAEPDTFFCFVELLSGFRDHFCQQLDNSVVGIRSTMTRLTQILRQHDEELWRHLEITTKVNPQFYAFRWITLLLTQEFNFADCLQIWDMLLCDPDGPLESLLRVCCAMLILIRRRLLAGDFTSNLKLLQHYPSTNISHLLYVADKLRGRSVQ